MKIRTYDELVKLKTFEDRLKYLSLSGKVGKETFGYDRYINQMFYRSMKWRKTRNDIIIRDNGCDLGVEGYDITDKIIIHHMNPVTLDDLETDNPIAYDPKYLICVSMYTHNQIHYGIEDVRTNKYCMIERKPNDTCPWL